MEMTVSSMHCCYGLHHSLLVEGDRGWFQAFRENSGPVAYTGHSPGANLLRTFACEDSLCSSIHLFSFGDDLFPDWCYSVGGIQW